VKLDYPHEVLTCVYGYYNTSREDGPRVLRSLTFITNRGKYGPFGDETGAYFSSAMTEGEGGGLPRPQRAAPGRHRRAHAALDRGQEACPQIRTVQVPLLIAGEVKIVCSFISL